jgi:hypothetical protein
MEHGAGSGVKIVLSEDETHELRLWAGGARSSGVWRSRPR